MLLSLALHLKMIEISKLDEEKKLQWDYECILSLCFAKFVSIDDEIELFLNIILFYCYSLKFVVPHFVLLLR
jgi:hypothetical protein